MVWMDSLHGEMLSCQECRTSLSHLLGAMRRRIQEVFLLQGCAIFSLKPLLHVINQNAVNSLGQHNDTLLGYEVIAEQVYLNDGVNFEKNNI